MITTDKDRLDWLEENLCYAMVRLKGNKMGMNSLPNKGDGWKNGKLREAIDRQIEAENV